MSDANIIRAPNTLRKAKSGRGPAVLDKQLLEQAEKAVQNMSVSYGEWVKDDLSEMESILKKLTAADGKDPDVLSDLYRVAFDTKGQGGSFGYPMLTQVAGSLADFVDERRELDRLGLEVVAAHVSTMRVVVTEDIRDDGGETGVELVKSLCVLVAKAHAAESARALAQ